MSENNSQQILLWEVGCEELPAWAVDQVLAQLPALVEDELAQARLGVGDVKVIAGPRRFAALAPVLPQQREETINDRGPAFEAAFGEDGSPTKACEGFARSRGLNPSDLEVREHDGRKFVYAVKEAESLPVADVWPSLAEKILARLNFAKPMKWGDTSYRFVRPVRWITTMLNGAPLKYDLWGVASGETTRTHRFLGSAREIAIPDAQDYEKILGDNYVISDQSRRRDLIIQGLDLAAKALGGTWQDPANVLSEVVHLAEYPTVITGRFSESYLELPERVLVTAMQSHQRYFPVRLESGGLAPAFLAVMNGSPDAVDSILPGYERVIVGRLDDAVFSFSRDRQRGLDDMSASLGSVVFHAKAGSLAERAERIISVALEVGRQLGEDSDKVKDAARLAKADQVSYVVQEFAELEGFAGSLYAKTAGYADDVCAAIDQQFRPKGAQAPMPDRGVPAVIALADKFELLVTAFSIGEHPTGSRDPHGLRRAAIGIMRILLEHDLQIDVDTVIRVAADEVERQGFATPESEMLDAIRSFLDDRLEKHLTDSGVRIDAVRAARGADLARFQHVNGLAQAIASKVDSADASFLSIIDSMKRCQKLLEKSGEDMYEFSAWNPDPALFEGEIENALFGILETQSQEIARHVNDLKFDDAVSSASTLAPQIDAFFDRDSGVMVMVDDVALRRNRLALLAKTIQALSPLGDLGAIQV